MVPDPAPEQGFQNFSAPTPDPAPFDLNFAGSAPLRLRPILKFAISHSFLCTEKVFGSLQNQKISFLACKIISEIIIFYKIFKNCWSLEPHEFMPAPTPAPAPFQFFKVLRLLKKK